MDFPKDYWSNLAAGYGESDALGFAPILHPQAPTWFNKAVDELQFAAFRRALTVAEILPDALCLDVGCGTGRWVRRYKEVGFSPIGVDATPGMLRIAHTLGTTAPLVAALASDLPFPDQTFDCVSDITVLQHIAYEFQRRALLEMVRVLKPEGRIILLELVRGNDLHIFPRSPHDWIRTVECCGTTLIKCFGQEYLFPDRLFVRMARAMSPLKGNAVEKGHPSSSHFTTLDYSTAQRVYWQLRRVTVSISARLEPAMANVFPPSLANHAMFVFRKNPI
jgi:ubiquinone/menaquinone biosynthesis C-methylase UbiE